MPSRRRFLQAAAAAALRIDIVRGDVTGDQGREKVMQRVGSRFEDLSALVFAAATGVHKPVDQLSLRHFDFTFALNVRAFLALMQAALPKLSGRSSVIALSSEGAQHAMPHYGLVGSSKASLESLCRHMAAELAPRGIRVNVLSPGTVATDAWKVLPDADRRLADAARRSPRGRLTTLEEIAAAAQVLASDASSGLAGHTLVVDGGARNVGVG